jgi:hypothetical protein
VTALREALEDLVNRWAVGGNGINAASRDLISACSAELLSVLDEHPAGEDAPGNEPAARYALVEQMGYRHVTGTVRETQFCGRPMLELTSLETGAVQLIAAESLYALTWLTRDQAERAAKAGAHSPAAIGSGRPSGPWTVDETQFDEDEDDDDIDPDEGKDDGMTHAEREAYDRDAEFRLDAADEARDLEREAEADA